MGNNRYVGAHSGSHDKPVEAKPKKEKAVREKPEKIKKGKTPKLKKREAKADVELESTVLETEVFEESPAPEADAPAVEEAPAKKGKGAKKKKRKKRASKFVRTLKIVVIILVVLAVLAAAGIGYAAYKVTNSETNLPNVYVGELFVGGMTREQTLAALSEYGWDEMEAQEFEAALPLGQHVKLNFCEAGIVMEKDTAAELAYRYGHSDNYLDTLMKYVRGLMKGVDIGNVDMTINSDYIYGEIDKAIAGFDALMEDKGYSVDEESSELVMLKGAGQVSIDRAELYNGIINAMIAGETAIEVGVNDSAVTAPDFDAIYKELAIVPIDAYYDSAAKEIVPSVDGFEFDVQKAAALWTEAEMCSEVRVPVSVIEPEMTTEKLQEVIFHDVLGSMSTGFASSNANRINNLRMACDKINGIVLNPGEVFSYNETLGQRTEAAGFLPAGAYADGQVVEEVGGGICQVSSTLYCATLYARLETVSRTCHYFAVAYMDKGIDATVSWPNPDFKFRNNTEYPIKIVTWFDEQGKTLEIGILGTAKDNYTVKLWHDTWTVSGSFTYQGHTFDDVPIAYSTLTYRSVYDENGALVYTEPVNKDANGEIYLDVYHFHDEDIIARLPAVPTTPSDSSSGSSSGGSTSGSGSAGGSSDGSIDIGGSVGTGGVGSSGGDSGASSGGGDSGASSGGDPGASSGGDSGASSGGDSTDP